MLVVSVINLFLFEVGRSRRSALQIAPATDWKPPLLVTIGFIAAVLHSGDAE